jgi:hypothetical protein
MLRLRGGGSIHLAPGGLIKQNISKVSHKGFAKTQTASFHLQILDSSAFQRVTGHAPPPSPISAATYAAQGLPFYALYDEPSNVCGTFPVCDPWPRWTGW